MPLYDMVKENRFRQDLLYRINTIEIEIPPLRDRLEDIPFTHKSFSQTAQRYNKNIAKGERCGHDADDQAPMARNIHSRVAACHWTSCYFSNSSVLQPEDFNFNASPTKKTINNSVLTNTIWMKLKKLLLIRKVLKKYNGNITQAAFELGLTRSSLYRRLEKHTVWRLILSIVHWSSTIMFKSFQFKVAFRVILIGLTMLLLVYMAGKQNMFFVPDWWCSLLSGNWLSFIISFHSTNRKLTRFLESVKYQDFISGFATDNKLGRKF